MKTKVKGSERVMFECKENGKRTLAEFDNVEEALQASGGYLSIQKVPVWWRFGMPGLEMFQDFKNLGQMAHKQFLR